jgi:hypothetical protein
MEFQNGQMLELDGMDVCVLDVQKINELDYIYVGEIVDDDITGNFYVYKLRDNNIEKVVNSDELKDVLPIFIESMSND